MDNGITFISELMFEMETLVLGFFVKTGAINEYPKRAEFLIS